MDKFCLIAIMLFAMQRDMVDYSITDIIDDRSESDFKKDPTHFCARP